MPELHKIIISLGSHNNLLVYPDSINVQRGDTVVWQIINLSDVQWIRIGTAGHLFTNLPAGSWNGIPVIISPRAPFGAWKYSVTYQNHATIGTLDPKIAIKPHPFTLAPVVIVLAIIIIPTMIFFRKNIISFFKGKNKTGH